MSAYIPCLSYRIYHRLQYKLYHNCLTNSKNVLSSHMKYNKYLNQNKLHILLSQNYKVYMYQLINRYQRDRHSHKQMQIGRNIEGLKEQICRRCIFVANLYIDCTKDYKLGSCVIGYQHNNLMDMQEGMKMQVHDSKYQQLCML